jgi:hypothetical protein
MFISSHENEHSFSNEAQRLVYQRLCRRTKWRLRNTRSAADSSLVHSSTLIPPHLFTPLTIVEINHFSATHLFLAHTVISAQRWWHLTMTNFYRHLSNCQPHHAVHISVASTTVLTTMTMHNTALGITSTKRTTLPLPGKSQRRHLSTGNIHNSRPIDSAHFAQPMPHHSTYTSPSLAHVCSDRPADSTRIVSYIRRQYVRTVPNVDIVGSSKCHTRHLATGGVARFNYVLVTNLNPVTTCASDGRVNPYPNNNSYCTGGSFI